MKTVTTGTGYFQTICSGKYQETFLFLPGEEDYKMLRLTEPD